MCRLNGTASRHTPNGKAAAGKPQEDAATRSARARKKGLVVFTICCFTFHHLLFLFHHLLFYLSPFVVL
jgi:hypothetical protein